GTTTPFYFGETITPELVNYDGNKAYGNGPKGKHRKETTDVGNFPPNSFGLYDMHGNVWEWCQDVWHSNYDEAPVDGSARVNGGNSSRRACRGGSWYFVPRRCRSANRNYCNSVEAVSTDFGFRVVSVPPQGS
ncbi:MAG: formylglycine-generating enzyme family protein, partial [Trichodesmium sp. St16_bin4-tuft]|nr:formylglycine-generating enzyme family protein [Trichodesmium sp. St16_bin4-tuft]